MKILAVVCQKGGVGKSTITVELASAAARAGYSVAIADTDPQASAHFWGETSADQSITVDSLYPVVLPSRLKALALTGRDLTIIDTPPHSKDIASVAIQNADFVLIPTRPLVFDLHATLETIEQCRTARKPASILLNQCPPSNGPELEQSIKALAREHTEICPVLLHTYIAYGRAQKFGKAVYDIDPNCKAATELTELTDFIFKKLGLRSRRKPLTSKVSA